MSQQKVDAYKETKVDRKAKLEKAKKKKNAQKTAAWIVFFAIIAMLLVALVITGINIYTSYKNSQPDYTTEEYLLTEYVTEEETTDISDYVSGDGTVIIDDEGVEVTDETEASTEAETEVAETEAETEAE